MLGPSRSQTDSFQLMSPKTRGCSYGPSTYLQPLAEMDNHHSPAGFSGRCGQLKFEQCLFSSFLHIHFLQTSQWKILEKSLLFRFLGQTKEYNCRSSACKQKLGSFSLQHCTTILVVAFWSCQFQTHCTQTGFVHGTGEHVYMSSQPKKRMFCAFLLKHHTRRSSCNKLRVRSARHWVWM